MGYNVVTIRSGDDIADDALYPVLSDEGAQYLVRLTEADGTPLHFNASSLDIETVVDSKVTTVLSLNDVSIECLITDSRVALACQKYDKGGGWVGFGAGAVVALAANGISKALAARRRRGSALVGQVRYPWLAQVGGKTKQGWLSAEQLRIVASRSKADGGGVIMLTLTVEDVDTRKGSHWNDYVYYNGRPVLQGYKTMGDLQKEFASLIDKSLKSAPAGSESAVAAVKSAMAAATSAYDNASKIVKQAVDLAESNFANATATAANTVVAASKTAAKRK